ncbi:MAG: nucleotide pyrophosphohydrolase [Patescibacteria group bacterium]
MFKLQNTIHTYLKARGWDKLPPADLAKALSIEASELLEHFQWGSPTPEEVRMDKGKFLEIQSEVADVFIYCLDIADRLGFDLEKATKEKLKKVNKKYPAKLFKESGATPGTELYWKIKKEYREKNK